jgi:type I restriction enzyme S subunit
MARVDTITGGRQAATSIIPGKWALSVGDPGIVSLSGFRWLPLSSLARLESGHTPSRRQPSYWDGDIPWIGIRDATGNHGRVIYSTNESVTELGIANSSARVLPAGTVCLSRTASVGYVVSMGKAMATSQDFVNWVCGPSLRPMYLHYILLLEQESVRRFAVGSVHPTVYYPEVKAFHVCIPEVAEQDAILEVLQSLDDKIAVNDGIATAVHNLAQAQCRRANEFLKPVELSEIAEITMGSSPPGESYNEDSVGLPFYQGTRDFGDRFPGHRVWCTAPVRAASAGSCLLSVRAPVGRVNVAREVCCIGRGVAAVRSKQDTPSVLFHELASASEVWVPFESEGTVFGAINKQQLANIQIPALDTQGARELEETLAPLDRRMASVYDENQKLAEMRDTLLPKLMSGEIRVKDAEKVVEDVT